MPVVVEVWLWARGSGQQPLKAHEQNREDGHQSPQSQSAPVCAAGAFAEGSTTDSEIRHLYHYKSVLVLSVSL